MCSRGSSCLFCWFVFVFRFVCACAFCVFECSSGNFAFGVLYGGFSFQLSRKFTAICLALEVVHNPTLRRRNRRASGRNSSFELRPGGCVGAPGTRPKRGAVRLGVVCVKKNAFGVGQVDVRESQKIDKTRNSLRNPTIFAAPHNAPRRIKNCERRSSWTIRCGLLP